MNRLPRIAEISPASTGAGFFLCTAKERRKARNGADYLDMTFQDVSGVIGAKAFQDVEALDAQFAVGDFVAVQGRGNSYNQRLELVLEKIRRVIPDDANRGFREEECILCSPRPVDEMWQELGARVESIAQPELRRLIAAMVDRHADRLKVWPAAVKIHHAYRSGLLEHVLKIIDVVVFLADTYGARRDLVIAGAILHDIGKLEELTYAGTTSYTLRGNLVGHIPIGVVMLRDALREVPEVPETIQIELEHLILSHHGSRELGSPVEPMTIEAFILAATDDLDATIHQVRRHIADDDSQGPFTTFNKRLGRVLLKPDAS